MLQLRLLLPARLAELDLGFVFFNSIPETYSNFRTFVFVLLSYHENIYKLPHWHDRFFLHFAVGPSNQYRLYRPNVPPVLYCIYRTANVLRDL